MMKVLFIANVFPEPTTTAAGWRIQRIVKAFEQKGAEVHFWSTAPKNTWSWSPANHQEIELNSSSFDVQIKSLDPNVVVFDRFMLEEQFGWRVAENCPNAVRVLDLEDLHFLRIARGEAVKKGISLSTELLQSDTAKREIAAILRSDCSLVISAFEMKLLQETFNIPSNLLIYAPFDSDQILEEQPSFDQRQDFFSIGNMLHAPNWDAVQLLKKEIWPLIRKAIPTANLNVYGAYGGEKVANLHNVKEGFLIHGRAPSAQEVYQQNRVLLAPLRFGAGLKGKLLEAMLYGVPSVTTSIGAEGMGDEFWGGEICDDWTDFANKSIELYQNQESWNAAGIMGQEIYSSHFYNNGTSEALVDRVFEMCSQISKHRSKNFFGQILQHQTLQSTKYMSKWIEAKNKLS